MSIRDLFVLAAAKKKPTAKPKAVKKAPPRKPAWAAGVVAAAFARAAVAGACAWCPSCPISCA